MNLFKHISHVLLCLWLMGPGGGLGLFAQSNPTPFVLAEDDYSFSNWPDASPAGTYPPNMIFHTGPQDAGLDAEPTGDYTGTYIASSGARINGLGADGFSFLHTSSAGQGYGIAAVLALDATGRQDIQVSWTGGTQATGERQYGIRLQYRIWEEGGWNDVLDEGAPVVYLSEGREKDDFVAFEPTLLPEECNDEALVQLRWKYYYISGSGTRPALRVGDITVASQPDGSPLIQTDEFVLTGFSYTEGEGPSQAQSFHVEGQNLAGNISITPPAHYETSLAGGEDFTAVDPLVLSPDNGTLSPTQVWVRLQAGLNENRYEDGFIELHSDGAITQIIGCIGTVFSATPSQHPTGLSATTGTASSLIVSWQGGDASRYLVKASTESYEDILAPVDGQMEGDALLVRNVGAGTQHQVFSGLDHDTRYYFRIFPYNGQGAAVNYKTGGDVPQDEKQTKDQRFGIPISDSRLVYRQDFNRLSGEGSGNAWQDNHTLPAWYWQSNGDRDPNAMGYNANTGSNNMVVGYSYGANGSPDRSLGLLSGSAGDIYAGVQFRNESGGGIPLSEILISYTGEQWRRNQEQALLFSYRMAGEPITDLVNGTWTANENLDFVAPHHGSIGAMDGNAEANREHFVFVPLAAEGSLAADDYLMLRWKKSGTNSPGLAIDDFSLVLGSEVLASESDGAWGNGDSWAGASAPGLQAAVRVDHHLTLEGPAGLAHLYVAPGKSLVIKPAGTLTVTGQIGVGGDPARLRIESGPDGSGSLLHEVEGVAATMERYLGGEAYSWHQLAAPVAGQEIGDGFDDGAFFAWHEPAQAWVSVRNHSVWPAWADANQGLTSFVPAKGYMAAYGGAKENGQTKAFAGELNVGTQQIALHRGGHAADPHAGFNLVGNPYPSAIDWKAAEGWGRDDLVDNPGVAFWVWNPEMGQYGSFHTTLKSDVGTASITRHIPAGQAFWVRAARDGTLDMDNRLRVHSNTPWFEKKDGEEEKGLIRLQVQGPGGRDELILQHLDAGMSGGVEKMFSMRQGVPSLYALVDEQAMGMVFMAPGQKREGVDVCLRPGEEGLFRLRASGADLVENPWLLHDRLEGRIYPLAPDSAYAFYASRGDISCRFRVLWSDEQDRTTSLPTPEQPDDLRIYVHAQTLHILSVRPATPRRLDLFDVAGRQLSGNPIPSVNHHTQSLSLPPGAYILRLTTPEGTHTQRIIITR